MIQSTHRFHGRSSLRFVYQRGQVVRGTLVSLRYVRNDRQESYRAAVVVSRKVSKSAVVRNRIRRRIYEIVRKHAAQITGPYDLVFTVYGEEAARLSHANLQKVILDELVRSGAIRANHGTIQNVLKSSLPGTEPPERRASRKKGEPLPDLPLRAVIRRQTYNG